MEALAKRRRAGSSKAHGNCSRGSYIMSDSRFSRHWEAARDLTMVVLLDLSQHLSKLHMIDALSLVLSLSTTLGENDAYLLTLTINS